MNRLTLVGTALLHRQGPGPTALLLHGIGSDAESWAGVIAALPPHLNALAWWAPGYGASAAVTSAHPTPEDYAARIPDLLDALRLSRVVLAGHSLGCLFAASFAVRHPDRITGLALLSPAKGYRVPPGAALPPAVQARIDELGALGPAEFAARRAARLVHDPAARPDVLARVRRAMAAVNAAGYAQAVHALGAGDLLADAARIAGPVLVACGEEDVVTPPHDARAVLAALPTGAALHMIPGAGHALTQEAPAAVAALIAGLAHGR